MREAVDELAVLFAWVHDYVTRLEDLAPRPDSFAPAYETLQSRRGDCDDHAVLMASLTQANGFRTQFLWVPRHVLAAVVLDDAMLAEYRTWRPARKGTVLFRRLLLLEVVAKDRSPGEVMPHTKRHLIKDEYLLETLT